MAKTEKEYWDMLRREAKDVLSQAQDNATAGPEAEDFDESVFDETIDEQINEYADSTVTYTHDCISIINHTQNLEAVEEDMGGDPSTWFVHTQSVTGLLCGIAYWAYRADLRETIDSFRSEYMPEDNPRRRKKKRKEKKRGSKKAAKKRKAKKRGSKKAVKKRGKKKPRRNPGKRVGGVRALVSSAMK